MKSNAETSIASVQVNESNKLYSMQKEFEENILPFLSATQKAALIEIDGLAKSVSWFKVGTDESYLTTTLITQFDVFIHVLTTGGIRIPVHPSILASASSVLKNIIDHRQNKNSDNNRTIQILGVPTEAVAIFVRFLYSSRCTEEEMDMYGFHLLTLSHVFSVQLLKQRCAKALIQRLKIYDAIDTLQLARLCDASELYFRTMKLVSANIKFVQKTEGWKFLQENDPCLELEILQFIDEIESRRKMRRKRREEKRLCLQLSEAMECLEHICTEGCTNIGPYDIESPGKKKKVPCQKFATYPGLQLLLRHFSTCKRRVNSGCYRCKRMWQLLQLHSSICDNPDLCKVPLCRYCWGIRF
ncbi:BTB/POZ and TAZ domain-containing protein 2-like [Impatiens glandulifera]|uniref:BTB/POZ and TAZ domain-containing protein 2-like n=1 Tax=Impatiens glandulifera TaxID=253017 RepID=UPI001FB0A5F7|nr:BTB/POZ and TAZ domain-containing protein 2-like [Impatiens glandulifera]